MFDSHRSQGWSVSVAKLVNATVYAAVTGGQTTLGSFLVATGLHNKVQNKSVHACKLGFYSLTSYICPRLIYLERIRCSL